MLSWAVWWLSGGLLALGREWRETDDIRTSMSHLPALKVRMGVVDIFAIVVMSCLDGEEV